MHVLRSPTLTASTRLVWVCRCWSGGPKVFCFDKNGPIQAHDRTDFKLGSDKRVENAKIVLILYIPLCILTDKEGSIKRRSVLYFTSNRPVHENITVVTWMCTSGTALTYWLQWPKIKIVFFCDISYLLTISKSLSDSLWDWSPNHTKDLLGVLLDFIRLSGE